MATPFGSTPGIITGVGVGTAASLALAPAVEIPKQDAWATSPHRILDVTMLARLVAQGGISRDDAHTEGRRDGYDTDKLDALIYAAQVAPPIAETLTLWRRFALDDDLWTHALVKAGVDPRYYPFLNRLKDGELVGVGDLAYAVVRGIVPSPSWVPVPPPTGTTNVQRYPMVEIDPVKQAARLGYSEDQFRVMVGRSGLSMAPVMAANGFFRGILADDDYRLAIAEGDLRTEWADAVRAVSREILTAHDYAELQLRGFYDRATRLGHTAKHGMSDADSDLLYDVLGRAIPVHGVTTGLARGGIYPSVYADVPEPYRTAIQRSNIREAWAGLAYANRYTYPSGFQVRSEAQKGDLSYDQTHALLLEMGWKPEWAAFFAEKWTGGATAAGNPYVAKAQTQLWNTTHRSYVAEEVGDGAAVTVLDQLGIAPEPQAEILALWKTERALVRQQLTLAQLKKAFTGQVVNPATGQPWSAADVTRALLDRGYSQADAQTILAEW